MLCSDVWLNSNRITNVGRLNRWWINQARLCTVYRMYVICIVLFNSWMKKGLNKSVSDELGLNACTAQDVPHQV